MSNCSICGAPMEKGEEMFKIHGSLGPCPKPPLPIETFEALLRFTVPVGPDCITPEGTPMSPDFRIAIQKITDDGVYFIIHASGYDSETLVLIARGNKLDIQY